MVCAPESIPCFLNEDSKLNSLSFVVLCNCSIGRLQLVKIALDQRPYFKFLFNNLDSRYNRVPIDQLRALHQSEHRTNSTWKTDLRPKRKDKLGPRFLSILY